MSSSRATYLPRWSNQLTEQLLTYKSTTPSPPPPPSPLSKVPSSSLPPQQPLKRLNNDSGTASVSHYPPNQENEKQHKVTVQQQQQQQQQQHDIPQLWSTLAKQLPTSTIDPKNKNKRTTVEPSWTHEEDLEEELDQEPKVPIGMFLFWFGFLCPFFWWIGSFWPRHADRQGKMAHRWQLVNRIMSISFCILLLLLLLAFGIWYRFAA